MERRREHVRAPEPVRHAARAGDHRARPVGGDALPRGVDPAAPREPACSRRPQSLGALVSGRLPQPCRPSHCEVLRLEGKGPIPSTPHLRLIDVGRAVLKPDTPFAPFVLPAPPTEMVARAVRYHTPQPSPIVHRERRRRALGQHRARDVLPLVRLVRAHRPGDVHPWTVDAFRAQGATADGRDRGELRRVPGDRSDGRSSRRRPSRRPPRHARLLLLGGEGGALLLAFTILAAAAMRRDVNDARRRLTWFGARRWQVELHTLRGVVRAGGCRHDRRLGRGWRRRSRDRGPRGLACRGRHLPRAALARGNPARRSVSRSPRRCFSTQPSARPRCNWGSSPLRHSTSPRSVRSRSS